MRDIIHINHEAYLSPSVAKEVTIRDQLGNEEAEIMGIKKTVEENTRGESGRSQRGTAEGVNSDVEMDSSDPRDAQGMLQANDPSSQAFRASSMEARPFEFSFNPEKFARRPSNGAGHQESGGMKRSAAPTSIPDFPGGNEPRPVAGRSSASPFSPTSPPVSPKGPKTAQSPLTPPQASSSRLAMPPQPFAQAFAGGMGGAPPLQSPWHALAATSGAPTPSLDGPGRNSPHLGGPFEKLNIGNAWSGGNLWAEGAQARRPSLDAGPSTASGSPVKGLNIEQMAKLRAMTGRASASGRKASIDESMAAGNTPSGTSGSKPPLPPALAKRRASIPKAALEVLSAPTSARGTKSPSPLSGSGGSGGSLASGGSSAAPSPPKSSGPASAGSGDLQPLKPADLVPLLSKDSALVLDLRPPSSYAASHLVAAHSLPIPSTLLRRPAFTIQKLTDMLSGKAQAAVTRWREMSDIVLLDADSGSAPRGSVLEGLAGKFARDGFSGQLWFVKGGQKALDASGIEWQYSSSSGDGEATASGTNTPVGRGLVGGGLGRLAFQSGSTNAIGGSVGKLQLPGTPRDASTADPFSASGSSASGGSDSGPSTRRSSSNMMNLRLGSPPKAVLQPANPFFDNIRQNLELAHGGITERIPLDLPEEDRERADELPDWLSKLAIMDDKDNAEELARQFYQIELDEQRRLQSVMDWHSRGSGGTLSRTVGSGTAGEQAEEQRAKDRNEVRRLQAWVDGVPDEQEGAAGAAGGGGAGEYNPFSISAGVERGTKNRYKNIWPYDYSRVRLSSPADDDSDYINASYIQPRGTSKRYIATQGPLDATYRDFWTLVWEQDVRVIVMLTRQFENGQLKCGNYWDAQEYGHLRLRLVEQSGGEDVAERASTGFDFGMPSGGAGSSQPAEGASASSKGVIRRVFELSRTDSPEAGTRKITQLQCVSWPDFDVPASPGILLSLIKDADAAMNTAIKEAALPTDGGDQPPVLVHCSAGVGRTGSFIVVDAVLDAMRREHEAEAEASGRGRSGSSVPPPRDLSESAIASSASPRPGGHFQNRPSITSFNSGGSALSGGSGNSTKAVSFVDVPDILEGPNEPWRSVAGGGGGGGGSSGPSSASPFFSTNTFGAPPLVTPHPVHADPSVSYFDAKDSKSAVDEDSMDVDPSGAEAEDEGEGEGQSPALDERFMRHRGSVVSNASSDGGAAGSGEAWRRSNIFSPGSVSATSKSSIRDSDGAPRPIQQSRSSGTSVPRRLSTASGSGAVRTVSPLSEMHTPIKDVLEGMRTQRMSLVQSLRQYVFVHRAIIHHFLAMLADEEADRRRQAPSAGAAAPLAMQGGAGGRASKEGTAESEMTSGTTETTDATASTSPSSVMVSGTQSQSGGASHGHGTEDESHQKRRASPTELQPERDRPSAPGSGAGSGASGSGSGTDGSGGEGASPGSTESGRLRPTRKISVKRMKS